MKRFDILPDDVLLDVFDFYVKINLSSPNIGKREIEAWQSLVHVCRRWRNLVFGSPRRLNLQLQCNNNTPRRLNLQLQRNKYTPAKDPLDVWPALPINIAGNMLSSSGNDSVIAVLGKSSRVRKVCLYFHNFAGWKLEEVLAQMQVPFPELTVLQLASSDKTAPVIPDSFLGGSAPRLRHFELNGIPFPGLPKLRLSTTHLVDLVLSDIPHSGYISPKAMAALLCALSSLRTLCIRFLSPQSCPDRESRSHPPLNRSILPALHEFRFKGVTEYLEELATRIDTPQVNEMEITFFDQINFDFPRFSQFINRTPTLRALDEATVRMCDRSASVILRYRTAMPTFVDFQIEISCSEADRHLSSIEQVCNSSLHTFSTVEDLYIEHLYLVVVWEGDSIENSLWLQLLRPFTAVKNLYLLKESVPGIAAALQELVDSRLTQVVLPSLQNIFVDQFEPSGPLQEKMRQFIAVRQLSDHPVTISVW